jgi:DNA mismatch endonuclease (patch repair protein)
MPATRTEFWETKIAANAARDERNLKQLHSRGWRTLIVWECAFRGRRQLARELILALCIAFITGTHEHRQIAEQMRQED